MSLSIRPGTLEQRDDAFIVQAFDSALPYLESIGSGAQWGSTPFSSKPDVVKEFSDFTARSERTAAREAELASTIGDGPRSTEEEGGWDKLLVAESPSSTPAEATSTTPLVEGRPYSVPVAAMGLQLAAPKYVLHLPAIIEAKEKREPFIYLQYLIVDRSAQQRGATVVKGAGSALLKAARGLARQRGCKWIFGDCWSGNGDGLVKYYEAQGFEAVAAFDVPSKHGPGLPWSGKLLRMKIEPEGTQKDAR